jgi:RNA polymerase sigma-70 factor (ECF subfamily)
VNAERFQRLLVEYGAALQRLTAGYATEPADREDLLQEIRVAVWHALPRFRDEASERTWLYRIAHNIAISASMRRKRRREAPLSDRPDSSRTPEAEYSEHERRSILIRAVRSLDGIDRQIMLLYLEGLSNGDIAEVVGFTEGAVATRLSRLRVRLAEQVGREARCGRS